MNGETTVLWEDLRSDPGKPVQEEIHPVSSETVDCFPCQLSCILRALEAVPGVLAQWLASAWWLAVSCRASEVSFHPTASTSSNQRRGHPPLPFSTIFTLNVGVPDVSMCL